MTGFWMLTRHTAINLPLHDGGKSNPRAER
jgi:hypothetical protein